MLSTWDKQLPVHLFWVFSNIPTHINGVSDLHTHWSLFFLEPIVGWIQFSQLGKTAQSPRSFIQRCGNVRKPITWYQEILQRPTALDIQKRKEQKEHCLLGPSFSFSHPVSVSHKSMFQLYNPDTFIPKLYWALCNTLLYISLQDLKTEIATQHGWWSINSFSSSHINRPLTAGLQFKNILHPMTFPRFSFVYITGLCTGLLFLHPIFYNRQTSGAAPHW